MDEIKPVAWRSKDYSPLLEGQFAWAFTANDNDLRPDHEPLYDQKAIDTLRAKVEAHKLNIDLIKDCAAGSLNMGRGLISEYAARAERAEAEAEALRKDAERYRWLREEAARYKGDDPNGNLRVSVTLLQRRTDGDGFTGLAVTPKGAEFDAAIDAAKQGAE